MTTILEFTRRRPAGRTPVVRRGRVWRAPRRVWIRRPWVCFEAESSSETAVDRAA